MNKAELESKHIAELHTLAAEADIPRYRMLRREELIEKLAGGEPSGRERSRSGNARSERPRRERSRSEKPAEKRDRPPRRRREPPAAKEAAAPEPTAEPAPEPKPARAPAPATAETESSRPRRKRRRRRFGRRSKGLRAHDLLTPPPGRQALVYGESRVACTALLREIAAELASASDGPDPIALLIDPSPEELAEWKREAPQAEIVAAGQARHASDALAQASRRAEGGEDVILLVDSLSRLADGFGDAEAAKDLFDGALTQAKGSLTVVAALERQP